MRASRTIGRSAGPCVGERASRSFCDVSVGFLAVVRRGRVEPSPVRAASGGADDGAGESIPHLAVPKSWQLPRTGSDKLRLI